MTNRPPFDDIPFPTDDPALMREAEASAARRRQASDPQGAEGNASGAAPRQARQPLQAAAAAPSAASRQAPWPPRERVAYGGYAAARSAAAPARSVRQHAPQKPVSAASSYASRARHEPNRFLEAYQSGMPLASPEAPSTAGGARSRADDASARAALRGQRSTAQRPLEASFALRAPAEELEDDRPVPVSEVLARLDEAVRGFLPDCWIAGEVSQATRSRAEHVYFSLKDEKGVLSCVIWRTNLRSGVPAEGDRIEVCGELQVYPPNGRLQLVVHAWRRAGRGALWAAFLALKAKLEAEGLFDPAKKRALPAFPKRIGLATSERAAAFGDVRRTLARRMPWVQIVFAEAAVQGPGAAASLVRALDLLDGAGCDVILLVRGGGAYEDLQAYNDEGLARAIRALKTPVVSGIGHETDFTIADFAADLRASTPTAAAEVVGRDGSYWFGRLRKASETMDRAVSRELRIAEERLDRADSALPRGEALLRRFDEGLRAAASQLEGEVGRAIAERSARVQRARRVIAVPEAFLEQRSSRLSQDARRLESAVAARLAALRSRLAVAGRAIAVPSAFLARHSLRLTQGAARLDAAINEKIDAGDDRLARLSRRLDDAAALRLSADALRFARAARLAPNPIPMIERAERTVSALGRTLAALDPDRPLRAGYARVSTADGIVGRAADIRAGDALKIEFGDGLVNATADRDGGSTDTKGQDFFNGSKVFDR